MHDARFRDLEIRGSRRSFDVTVAVEMCSLVLFLLGLDLLRMAVIVLLGNKILPVTHSGDDRRWRQVKVISIMTFV